MSSSRAAVSTSAGAEAVARLEQRPGTGMDRPVIRRRRMWPIAAAAFVVAFAAWALSGFVERAGIRSMRVDATRITVSTVRKGTFHDYLPVRGQVTPLSTVYLDAIEGGRVETVLAEEAAMVEPGQPILELSNTALQLDVISREAQVAEQLNNLRNTRLAMEQNRLALARELVEIDYQIKRLSRLAERRQGLAAQGVIPRQDAEETRDELEYYRNRRAVILESQAQEERMRRAQIESLESGVAQLEHNLAIARQNLDSLVIRAPIRGQLTSLDAERGASKARGERLGQIDDVDDFKVTARIDEYYLPRLRRGQEAGFTLSGRKFRLAVNKVYPQVNDGQFEVDFEFAGDAPANVRRGQTLQLEIALGDREPALLLPSGGFFRDTGGNWAFVLDDAGGFAHRRPIELGRRSPDYFEVLSGLEPGDRVVTSDYSAFAGMDRIELEPKKQNQLEPQP